MKNKFSHSISLVLLAIFMLATIGIPITKHVCMVTGHADVALFANTDFKDCCPVKKDCTNPSKAGCCDQEHDFLQLNIDTKSETIALWKLTVPSFTLNTATYTTVVLASYTSSFNNTSSPPPEQGTDLVIRLANFRC